jgi:alkyl sulfatase BDS1-like metallo-beta-lactamase superfamily hydrolase
MLCRSVRAIYSNELGWFDGEAEDLYPMALDDEAHRMTQLMGGVERVMGVIKEAQKAEDHAWALRLIKLLRTAAPKDPSGEAM